MARRRNRACLFLLAIAGASTLNAAVLTSPSAFSGSETVITFNSVTQTTPVDPFGPLNGVTFDGAFNFGFRTLDGSSLFGASAGNALQQDGLLTSNFSIDFGSHVVNRAGLLLAAGSNSGQPGQGVWQVSAFDAASNLLDTATVTSLNTPLGTGTFIGFEYANNQIKTITITKSPGENFTFIDDVRFEEITTDASVPEPASLLLWTCGALGLSVVQRRRQRGT